MANLSPVDFIKPVPPGISWTAEPRSSPWSVPPQLVNVNEVAQRYITSISAPSAINGALDVIETKTPLAAIANAMMLVGVASNVHTIDAGILVIPIIIEMLVTLAEIHGVEYTVFPKDPDEGNIPDRVVRKALMKAKETPVEINEDEPVVEMSGLMSRTNNMENT